MAFKLFGPKNDSKDKKRKPNKSNEMTNNFKSNMKKAIETGPSNKFKTKMGMK